MSNCPHGSTKVCVMLLIRRSKSVSSHPPFYQISLQLCYPAKTNTKQHRHTHTHSCRYTGADTQSCPCRPSRTSRVELLHCWDLSHTFYTHRDAVFQRSEQGGRATFANGSFVTRLLCFPLLSLFTSLSCFLQFCFPSIY